MSLTHFIPQERPCNEVFLEPINIQVCIHSLTDITMNGKHITLDDLFSCSMYYSLKLSTIKSIQFKIKNNLFTSNNFYINKVSPNLEAKDPDISSELVFVSFENLEISRMSIINLFKYLY